MKVTTMVDGSFRFEFEKGEKHLGVQLLSVLFCPDEEVKANIEYAKYRIVMAGVLTTDEVKPR